MKFETGHFYLHEKGRAIAIHEEVTTYKAGKQLFVEETDPTGHGFSTMNVGSVCIDKSWKEIDRDEWDLRFKEILSCPYCGLALNGGQAAMKDDAGNIYHLKCWGKVATVEE